VVVAKKIWGMIMIKKEGNNNLEMGVVGEQNILEAIKNLICIEQHCLDNLNDPEIKKYHHFIRTMRQDIVKSFIDKKVNPHLWCLLKHGFIVEVCLGEAILKQNQKMQSVDELIGKYKIIKELNEDLWAQLTD